MGNILAGIPPELLTGGSAAGIVVLAVVMVLTGRLVPRATHEELEPTGTHGARPTRTRSRPTRSRRPPVRSRARQIDELLESARATERIMTAMQQTLQNLQRRGGGR